MKIKQGIWKVRRIFLEELNFNLDPKTSPVANQLEIYSLSDRHFEADILSTLGSDDTIVILEDGSDSDLGKLKEMYISDPFCRKTFETGTKTC